MMSSQPRLVHLGLEYGETVGSRINDHHLTLAEKREAREKVTKEGS